MHHGLKHREIAITLWAIWFTRNKLVHKGTNQGVRELVVFIRSYCGELVSLFAVLTRLAPSTRDKWSPPLERIVKVNVDASFHQAQHNACSGVIIRDNHEAILVACSRLIWPVSSVFFFLQKRGQLFMDSSLHLTWVFNK